MVKKKQNRIVDSNATFEEVSREDRRSPSHCLTSLIREKALGKLLDTMNVLSCEVAVDTETGDVDVLRHFVVVDPGKVIRRTSLEGQLHQVMMFSEGAQLAEEFAFNTNTGVKLHTNMFDHKKPTILDIGPVHSVLIETRAGNAAYDANGISHSMANTHLIICAIQNAIGAWIDPPATPDRILKALGKA